MTRMAAAPLLALLLVAAACGGTGASLLGGSKSPEAAMIAWLKANGGESAVAIDTPKGGARGTFALRDVPRDGLIAKIPLKCAVWFPASYSDFSELGVQLAREGLDRKSRYAPYLDALPMLRDYGNTISFETFPLEYVHLIQSDVLAHHITSTQTGTLNYWASNGAALTEEGITLDLLKASLMTVATRYFGISHHGTTASIMIPLLDFANHFQNCTNYYEYRPCALSEEDALRAAQGKSTPEEEAQLGADATDQEGLCCYWRAGSDVKKGQEVCNRYGYMAPDQAFFQYGFNLPDEPPALCRVDQPNYSTEYIFGSLAHEEPTDFDGPLDALEAEADRLASQLDLVRGAAAAEAKAPLSKNDPGGAVLAGLRELRRQRIAALEAEIARLGERIREERASGGGAAEDGREEL